MRRKLLVPAAGLMGVAVVLFSASTVVARGGGGGRGGGVGHMSSGGGSNFHSSGLSGGGRAFSNNFSGNVNHSFSGFATPHSTWSGPSSFNGVRHNGIASVPQPTLFTYYGNADAYTEQLRALETYVRDNPKAAEGHFLLAVHYIMTGSNDAARKELTAATALTPNDKLAEHMLKQI
jgi:hypothetical protein